MSKLRSRSERENQHFSGFPWLQDTIRRRHQFCSNWSWDAQYCSSLPIKWWYDLELVSKSGYIALISSAEVIMQINDMCLYLSYVTLDTDYSISQIINLTNWTLISVILSCQQNLWNGSVYHYSRLHIIRRLFHSSLLAV